MHHGTPSSSSLDFALTGSQWYPQIRRLRLESPMAPCRSVSPEEYALAHLEPLQRRFAS